MRGGRVGPDQGKEEKVQAAMAGRRTKRKKGRSRQAGRQGSPRKGDDEFYRPTAAFPPSRPQLASFTSLFGIIASGEPLQRTCRSRYRASVLVVLAGPVSALLRRARQSRSDTPGTKKYLLGTSVASVLALPGPHLPYLVYMPSRRVGPCTVVAVPDHDS